jgi:hypothetical protein
MRHIGYMNRVRDSKGRFHGAVRATQITNTLAEKSVKGGKTWVKSGSQSAFNEEVVESNPVLVNLEAGSTTNVVFIPSNIDTEELISGQEDLDFQKNHVQETKFTIETIPSEESIAQGEFQFLENQHG